MSRVMCHMCTYVGDVDEFQEHNEDLAPDLAETGVCPFCDAFIEDISEFEVD